MQYCRDYIARYISASNSEKIKEILKKLDELQIDFILSEIEKLWQADDLQKQLITQLKTQINNVSLLYCTKEEYDSFSTKPQNTLYIVNNPDNTITLYAGTTPITAGGGGGGGITVEELTREQYDNLSQYDINKIYIVTEDNTDVTIYIGHYQISGSGDILQLEQRVSAIENQITIVGLRSLTRLEYDGLQTHENNVIYLVQNSDLSIQMYVGDTLINSDGGSGGIILGFTSTINNLLNDGVGFLELGIIGFKKENE